MNKKSVPNLSSKGNFHKGQALLFVVVATTIAMVVGVNVANRSLSSARRTTSTDTFTRVLNAAEGAIELAVAASTTDLNTLANGTAGGICQTVFGSEARPNDGTSACVVPYTDSLAEAEVTVEFDQNYDEDTPLEDSLGNPGTVYEVVLQGYDGDTVKLCWGTEDGGTASADGTALYYVLYSEPDAGQSSVVVRQGLQKEDFASNSLGEEAFIPLADASGDGVVGENFTYDVCRDIDVRGDDVFGINQGPYGLRIKSTHRPTNFAVVPESGHTLPRQGHRITAIGRLVGASGDQNISKTVTATKSFSFLPAIFDYAIYMHEGSLTKGN